jgi:hypothetical protein
MEIWRYHPERARDWDNFVNNSRNGTFLFRRAFMDYHADRFSDHSLIAISSGSIIAVLPANERDGTIWSHQGLTYGGWVYGDKMRATKMLSVFDKMKTYLANLGMIERVIYKAVPEIYHRVPSAEDLYALFRNNAQLIRRDSGTVVVPSTRLPVSSRTKRNIRKAKSVGIELRRSKDLATFHAILTDVLARHGAKPIHSIAEIEFLSLQFPENIKLYGAFLGPELVAGSLIFDTPQVAHTQYLASSVQGRSIGALDYLLDWLISEAFVDKKYFSFGISTEDEGTIINEGLVSHKEGLGGSSYTHDFYELQISKS